MKATPSHASLFRDWNVWMTAGWMLAAMVLSVANRKFAIRMLATTRNHKIPWTDLGDGVLAASAAASVVTPFSLSTLSLAPSRPPCFSSLNWLSFSVAIGGFSGPETEVVSLFDMIGCEEAMMFDAEIWFDDPLYVPKFESVARWRGGRNQFESIVVVTIPKLKRHNNCCSLGNMFAIHSPCLDSSSPNLTKKCSAREDYEISFCTILVSLLRSLPRS